MSRILVIDDDPGNRLIVKSRLCDLGYEVLTEDTGANGLMEARAGAVDLVMVAAGLGSGIEASEVCRRLKAIPETGAMPVLIYSNLPAAQEELGRVYQAGCDAFVPKPQMPVLDQIVRVLLRNKALQDDLSEQVRVLEQQNRRLSEDRQKQADFEISSRASGEQSLAARELAAGRPDGVLIVDADGFVRFADRGACGFFGNRVEGKNLGSLAPSSGLEAFVRDARTESREGFRCDLPSAGRRTTRSLSASVIPLVSSCGGEDGGLKIVLLLDSARRRLASEILRATEPGVPHHQLGPLLDAARIVYRPEGIAGDSESVRAAREAIFRHAHDRDPLLVTGPAGAGKAHFARTLHYASVATGPFLEIRCTAFERDSLERELFGCVKGAFPEALADGPGMFHRAADGTLYLEELGGMPLSLQERLALFLEEGRILRQGSDRPELAELRIVAGSSVPLERAVEEGRFLPRLLGLFGARSIHFAPLRERPEDLHPLARHFLSLYGAQRGLSDFEPDALAVLYGHDWQGNVDELEDCVRRACEQAFDCLIHRDHLPQSLLDSSEGLASIDIIPSRRGGEAPRPAGVGHLDGNHGLVSIGGRRRRHVWDITDEDPISLEHYEKMVLIRALEHVGGDKIAAARLLNVGKSTLYRKLKRFDLR